MPTKGHDAAHILKTIKGQLSCIQRNLIRLSNGHGDLEAPGPDPIEGGVDQIGCQCLELTVFVEELQNLVDDFTDRVREAYELPPVSNTRDRNLCLTSVHQCLTSLLLEPEYEHFASMPVMQKMLKDYSYDVHRSMSSVIARERAKQRT